jgi:hypothetical protein
MEGRARPIPPADPTSSALAGSVSLAETTRKRRVRRCVKRVIIKLFINDSFYLMKCSQICAKSIPVFTDASSAPCNVANSQDTLHVLAALRKIFPPKSNIIISTDTDAISAKAKTQFSDHWVPPASSDSFASSDANELSASGLGGPRVFVSAIFDPGQVTLVHSLREHISMDAWLVARPIQ